MRKNSWENYLKQNKGRFVMILNTRESLVLKREKERGNRLISS